MSSAEYFDNLAAQVANINSCAELQATTNGIMAQLSVLNTSLTSQQAAIAPIAGLLSAPVDPAHAVTWIASFITAVLEPAYAPYAIYGTQLADLTTAVTNLTTAINDAAARIGNCSITIPPL